jgi:hypothetical protein
MIINKSKTVKQQYSFPDKIMETLFMDKAIKQDMRKVCKEQKINKSKLIEEFYKTIILRFREGSLNTTNGYITINIFRKPICSKI